MVYGVLMSTSVAWKPGNETKFWKPPLICGEQAGLERDALTVGERRAVADGAGGSIEVSRVGEGEVCPDVGISLGHQAAVEDAEAATKDSVRLCLIGKTDARTKVRLLRIRQSLVVRVLHR